MHTEEIITIEMPINPQSRPKARPIRDSSLAEKIDSRLRGNDYTIEPLGGLGV